MVGTLHRILNGTMNNGSTYDDDQSQDDQSSSGTIYEYLGLVCSLAMITISIVGVVGNGYAVWHFGRPSRRSSVYVLLTALSTFDLTLLITGTPIYSLLGIYSYDQSHTEILLALGYCTMVLYPFSHMAQMGSVWTMMLISLERYLGVCHPFIARREVTVERARICVIMVAVISILYNICRFWEYGINSDGLPEPILRSDVIYVSLYVHWLYFVFIFSIPFLIIFIFNVLVSTGVRKATINRPRCQLSAQQRGERKTTLMLLVVVLVFFACNSLAWLLNGYEMLGYQPTEAAFEFVSDLNNLLILAHPTFNILVYARFSSKFRHEFVYCLCRRLRPALIAATPPGSFAERGDYNSNSLMRRNNTKYCVLDAAVIHFNGDQNERSSLRPRKTTLHTFDHHNSISASTTTTIVGSANGDHSDKIFSPVLVDGNKEQILKTIGYKKISIGGKNQLATAV